MKQLKYIILFIAFQLSSIVSFANKDLQLKAEKLYADKKYQETITIYDSLIKSGYHSFKLYYNLGNAYYKHNELGKAIYHYELARKLEPQNKDVKTNLIIANKKTIDQIETKEHFFIEAIKSGIVNSISTTYWAWISIISLVILLASVYLFLIKDGIIFKRITFFISLATLFTFISSLTIGYIALNDKQALNYGIILCRESKIYEEPINGANTKFNLHEGTKFNIIESTENFTNIKLENGNEGWIKNSDAGFF